MGCCNGGSNPVEDLATFNVLRAWTTHFACCSEWNPKGPHTYHPTHLKPIVCTISGFPRIKSVGPEGERCSYPRTGPPAPAVTKHCLTGRIGAVSPQYRQGYVKLGEPGSIDISCDGAPLNRKEPHLPVSATVDRGTTPPRISRGRPRSDQGTYRTSPDKISPGLGEPSPTNISCVKAPPIWTESPPRISHGRPRSDRGIGHFSTELVPTCWGNQVRSITAVPKHRPIEKTKAHRTSHGKSSNST
ncbi:hypothetical protein NQZ68_042410 [Dissostichus eleginoides]|nr:hypothetical protein NQZ68_042410 [Dissostichus eleginoides]